MTRRNSRTSTQPTEAEGQVQEQVEEPQPVDGEATEPEQELSVEEQLRIAQEKIAELMRRPERKPRVVKPTDKQIRFMRALQSDPSATLADLVSAAGAGGVTEPHGFVYRLIANGYLRLTLPEETVTKWLPEETDEAEVPEGSTEEQQDATAA